MLYMIFSVWSRTGWIQQKLIGFEAIPGNDNKHQQRQIYSEIFYPNTSKIKNVMSIVGLKCFPKKKNKPSYVCTFDHR